METVSTEVIGKAFGAGRDTTVDNAELIHVNKTIRQHPVEQVGSRLRASMTAMKPAI